MKQTIFPIDFAGYYPAGIRPCPMYVDVANRIYERIQGLSIRLPGADELRKEIAINVAIYYEDKMSKLGLWNAFVSLHMDAYHRPLPFYEVDGVLEDEDVNAQEVELLVWIVMSRNFDDQFINPLAMDKYTAKIIMDVLTEDDEIEINDELYDFVYRADQADDFFKLKRVLLWLRKSYLLCSPLAEAEFDDLAEGWRSTHFNKRETQYYSETTFAMTTEIGPIALLPHWWLAEMYQNNGMFEASQRLRNLQYRTQDIFKVVAADTDYAVLKDSKAEEYKLQNVYPDLFRKGRYVSTALVKYGNCDWEINGYIANADMEQYNFRCERNKELQVSYERVFPMYMEKTDGKRLAFFENARQRKDWLKKVAPGIDIEEISGQLPTGPQVVFISKKAGIIFAPNITHAIKCAYNPFYRKCDADTMQQETVNALCDTEAMHPELLQYLLENEMLQDGDISSLHHSETGNRIFTRNIDFIARNHRRQYYHDHDY